MPITLADIILSHKERVSFPDRMVSEFISSVEKTRVCEIDFRRLVGENPPPCTPFQLPEVSIKLSFVKYCINYEFYHPKFLHPLRGGNRPPEV